MIIFFFQIKVKNKHSTLSLAWVRILLLPKTFYTLFFQPNEAVQTDNTRALTHKHTQPPVDGSRSLVCLNGTQGKEKKWDAFKAVCFHLEKTARS